MEDVSEQVSRKRVGEQEVANQLRDALAPLLPRDYVVSTGKSILYRIEVNALGKVTPDNLGGPRRGSYAFQTDILIEKKDPLIPVVAIELKTGTFSTHDVITYSSKAGKHKEIYPYLRYGFVIVGQKLARRFVTHNQGFDFALSMLDSKAELPELAALVSRQIASGKALLAHAF